MAQHNENCNDNDAHHAHRIVDPRVPHAERTTKRKTKRNTNRFSSRASSQVLREYQITASRYPPLSHEQIIILSERFCRGREAKSLLDEYELCDELLNGEWSADSIENNKDKIIDAYEKKLSEYRSDSIQKDIADQWEARLEHIQASYSEEMLIVSDVPKHRKGLKRSYNRGNEALATIIDHNMQLAMSRIGKLIHRSGRDISVDVEDLIGAANLGLVLGARQFDPSKGKKFSTYAAFHIDGQLYALLDSENNASGMTGISPHEQKQLNTIVNIATTFNDFFGRVPTSRELYSLTGIMPSIIEERVTTPRLTTKSLYAPRNDDPELMIVDRIPSRSDTEKELERMRYDESLQSMIQAVKELPLEYQKIVLGRTGIIIDGGSINVSNKPKTNRAIAIELGITPNAANKRYSEALSMLHDKMINAGYNEDVILDS